MSSRSKARIALSITVLAAIVCLYLWRSDAMVSAQSMPGQAPTSPGSVFGPGPFENPQIHERQIRALNEQRQKQLVADAKRLLQAATELHNEMVSQSFKEPTPRQMEKLDRIEKLAKKVRERMIYAVGDTGPLFRDPFMRADQ